MKILYLTIQAVASGVIAFISAKLGILFPVFCILLFMMVIDYITGMMASKVEAIDHPNDIEYGWSSKKGAKGIIKKVAYICIIAVAMVMDYIIISVAGEAGIKVPVKAFFGLLVSVWYVLNEILSIIENAGRMGAQVPQWLQKYIAVLKDKVDSKAEDDTEKEE